MSLDKINGVCVSVLDLTDEDFKDLEEFLNEKIDGVNKEGYFLQLKINAIDQNNRTVIGLLKQLHTHLRFGHGLGMLEDTIIKS